MILRNSIRFLLLTFCLFFFFLGLPGWLAAQTTTTETNRERPTNNQPVREQRANLQPAAADRISGLVSKMNDRFEVVIARLQNIADRLASRGQKVNEVEANVAAADTYVTSAKEKLSEATALTAETDRMLQALLDSATPRENWTALRAHLAKIKSLIRGAHNDLLRALSALRTDSPNRRATSTNPSSPDQTENVTESSTAETTQ